MPNYCDNSLTIKGHYKDVTKFLNDFYCSKRKDFDMGKIYPTFNKVSDWGTKFNVVDCNPTYSEIMSKYDGLEKDYNDLIEEVIYYQTATTPNEEFFKKISNKYPNITFILGFYEPGEGYVGKSSFINGLYSEDEYYESKSSSTEDYYGLAIELKLESADYIINEMESDLITMEFKKELSEKYNIKIIKTEDNVIDLRDILVNKPLPEPE